MGHNVAKKRLYRTHEDYMVDVMARTIWGEARSEGYKGMLAVACVIKNRYTVAQEKSGYWWGNTIAEICQKPYQFSCWNASDPNRKKLQSVTIQDTEFKIAKRIAGRVVRTFRLDDITHGADHYHTDAMCPSWMDATKITKIIGRHVFYKLV